MQIFIWLRLEKKSVVIENLLQFQLFCVLNVFSAAVT